MKGIVLAGGKATRLYPITNVVSKQLLPIYDKPMVYYPLSILLNARIRDILIISTPRDLPMYEELLGDGSQLGIKLSYKVQPEPKGLAQAFILGEEFIGNDSVALVLGDNVIYGNHFIDKLRDSVNPNGGLIFAYQVSNPEVYGVVEFDKEMNVVSIEEKPKKPKSNYAVPGIYFYDNDVIEIAKGLKPSARGELEITSVHNEYLKRGKLKVQPLSKSTAWLDTGSFTTMIQASEFVKIIEDRQNIKIGCIEEIVYNNGWIDAKQVRELAEPLLKSGYGEYLLKMLEE